MKKIILLLSIFALLFALPVAKTEAYTYTYVGNGYLNQSIPAGWTVIHISEPFVFNVFTYVRVYLVNYSTGQMAVWLVAIQ